MRCEWTARASRTAVVWVGLCAIPAAVDLPASAGRDTSVSLRSIRVESDTSDGTSKVVIEANGGLPEPTSEALVDPPRIYLDFTDTLAPRTLEPSLSSAVVARVRVAEHSTSPLVTRVVVDLNKPSVYRIDSSARTQGRVVVIIGAPRSADARIANTTAPAVREPATRVAAVETQYGVRVATAVARLQTLRPLLDAIDRRQATTPGDLTGAANEFDDVAKLLTTIKPPPSRASTHALLLRTCTLGARAVRLRQATAANQDSASGWEAASAAAGALLMLERANTDLMAGKR